MDSFKESSPTKRMRVEGPPPRKPGDLVGPTVLEHLPNEVILKILAHVKKCDLAQVACLNHRFRLLAADPSLWSTKILFLHEEPIQYLHLGGAHVLRIRLVGYQSVEQVLRRVGQYCPNLVDLDVARCGSVVCGDGDQNGWAAVMAGCPELRSVRMFMTLVDDDVTKLLMSPKLEKLKLIACNGATHDLVMKLLDVKPNLHTLDLTDCDCWSDSLLAHIVEKCSGTLKVLYGVTDVSNCSFSMINELALEALSVHEGDQINLRVLRTLAPNLRILKFVAGWAGMDPMYPTKVADLMAIADFPVLKHLCLSFPYLSNVTVEGITTKLKGLKTLVLESPGVSADMNDEIFGIVVRHCPNLRDLALVRARITSAGMAKFVVTNDALPFLAGFFLNAPYVNNQVLAELVRRRPELKVVNATKDGPKFSHPGAGVQDDLWHKTLGNPDLSDYPLDEEPEEV